MNFEEFSYALEHGLKKMAPSAYRIRLTQTEKNNGTKKDVICIEEDGICVAPAMFLDHFYDLFLKGTQIMQIEEMILDEYEKIRLAAKNFSPDCFLNYEDAHRHIYCRLVSEKMNRELLKRVPWTPFLDLALVYYYEMHDNAIPDGCVLVTREQLRLWGISEEEFKATAWDNTRRDKEKILVPLENLLEFYEEVATMEGFTIPVSLPLAKGSDQMILLSNTDTLYGAVSICYPGVLEEIAELLEADYYLIPSSIHEWLILAVDNALGAAEINEMITMVNSSEVPDNEILSDHAYHYDRERKCITALATFSVDEETMTS